MASEMVAPHAARFNALEAFLTHWGGVIGDALTNDTPPAAPVWDAFAADLMTCANIVNTIRQELPPRSRDDAA